MGRGDQSPRERRFVGDRARPTPLTPEQRAEILRQLEGVRRRYRVEPPPVAEADRAVETEEDDRSSGEEAADRARERGVADRMLADSQRVVRPLLRSSPPPPRAEDTPTTRSPSPPSRGRTADPPSVDPELGQRVDHALDPDSPTPGRARLPVVDVPDVPASARRTIGRTHDALDELNSRYFRDLWSHTAERLSRQARSRHDAPLARLRQRFERLMGRHPHGITTREAWEEACDIFDDAYKRARSRWSSRSMWTAVWGNLEATRRLQELERRGLIHIQLDDRGKPTGAPQIRQYNQRSGRWSWVPINIDHAVPLERNPWGVLARDNLVATTPYINQTYLVEHSRHSAFPMAVDRFGGRGDVTDSIEEFVIANGLSRQRRATAAQLDARYRPRPQTRTRPDRGSRRRGQPTSGGSEIGRRVIRGSIPLLTWALEMLVGASRRSLYQQAVEELREEDEENRRRRQDYQFRTYSVHPQNLQQTFERVVGDRHPVRIHQAGELRQRFQRWLEHWDRADGEGWRIADIILNQAEFSSPDRRERILTELQVEVIDRMRALQSLHQRISTRLREQDWEALEIEATEAADNFDSLIEGELQELAIDIEDADYLSRTAFRRIARAYRNFHQQLSQLQSLVFDAMNRYRRLIEQITLLTAH